MRWILGLDEVGYGAWAGPIHLCGVLAPADWSTDGLADSKELGRKQHQVLYQKALELKDSGILNFDVAIVPVEEIDIEGPMVPMKRAKLGIIERLRSVQKDSRVVVDGELDFPEGWKDCWSVPKADSFVPSVMLASNIAKHLRDTYMIEQSVLYPNYGFEKHVGYGVPRHREALHRHGVCPIHRSSYAPIRDVLEKGILRPEDPGLQPVSLNLYAAWRKNDQANS